MKFLLVALVLFCPPLLYSQTTAEIFIVRHADRIQGDDLSAAGLARAQELKRVLGGVGIKRIFSTDFVRTRKTAKPLADLLNLTTIIYPSVSNLVSQIKNQGANLRHLVVGHSDTVDDIIAGCGCRPPSEIPATQFDNLFLVLLKKSTSGGTVTWSCEFMRMKYGAVTN